MFKGGGAACLFQIHAESKVWIANPTIFLHKIHLQMNSAAFYYSVAPIFPVPK
jgi:hypothetical protein